MFLLRNGQVNLHQVHQPSILGWGQAAGLDVLPMQDKVEGEDVFFFLSCLGTLPSNASHGKEVGSMTSNRKKSICFVYNSFHEDLFISGRGRTRCVAVFCCRIPWLCIRASRVSEVELPGRPRAKSQAFRDEDVNPSNKKGSLKTYDFLSHRMKCMVMFAYIWLMFMVNVGLNIPYIDPMPSSYGSKLGYQIHGKVVVISD